MSQTDEQPKPLTVYDFAGDDEGREAGRVEVVAKGHDGWVTVQRQGGGEVFLAEWERLTKVEG